MPPRASNRTSLGLKLQYLVLHLQSQSPSNRTSLGLKRGEAEYYTLSAAASNRTSLGLKRQSNISSTDFSCLLIAPVWD